MYSAIAKMSAVTTLSAQNVVLPAASLGPENQLAHLRTQHELHQVENLDELPAELRDNIQYGRLHSTLPCLNQHGYDRTLVDTEFTALVLENDDLRATVLPGLGGRLYSLVHKATGQELLYRNPVFQPANLALRNAWFAGGVEWNVRSTGHWTGTCAPMHAARVDGPDGTPVLRLWELERTRNLVTQVDFWLPEDSQFLYVGVRLQNPSDTEVPAYWWSNIAVEQSPETRVLVRRTKPGDSGTGAGSTWSTYLGTRVSTSHIRCGTGVRWTSSSSRSRVSGRGSPLSTAPGPGWCRRRRSGSRAGSCSSGARVTVGIGGRSGWRRGRAAMGMPRFRRDSHGRRWSI